MNYSISFRQKQIFFSAGLYRACNPVGPVRKERLFNIIKSLICMEFTVNEFEGNVDSYP